MGTREGLIDALERLTANWTEFEDVPKSQQNRAKQIGLALYAEGGEALMREAYYAAKGNNRPAAVVAAYWDGIANWRW